MKKFISVIVIFTLIIIIYFCNNIENFTTSKQPENTQPETTNPGTTQPETTQPENTQPETTNPGTTQPETTQPETTQPETTQPETTQPETTQPETTQPETTNPGTTKPAILRKSFGKKELYLYMNEIEKALSSVLNLQNQNYNDELHNEEITNILNELKDEFNQKNIISESVIDISQKLQDKDIKKLKQDIENLKNNIPKIKESNFIKHISTGKIFEILNDPNNNKQYLEVNKDLNLCLSHEHNKLTDDNIQTMIDNKKEIDNINLEHCDFDSDKQYIYLSNEIKNPDNSDFNKELHYSTKQYGSLSENSKLNNYPFYHLYPEDYDKDQKLKNKKYCLTLDNEHLSIEKCSGKNSQRFLKV